MPFGYKSNDSLAERSVEECMSHAVKVLTVAVFGKKCVRVRCFLAGSVEMSHREELGELQSFLMNRLSIKLKELNCCISG